MKQIMLAVAMFFCLYACGQQTGIISAQSSTCTSDNTSADRACVVYQLPANTASITLNVIANASGNTLQFEGLGIAGGTWVAVNATPPNSTTAVTSTTSTGTWVVATGGLAAIRVRCSTFVSGTASVGIGQPSRASLGKGGSGGGITNSAPNTHLMESDGTNATDSGLTSNGLGDLGATSVTTGTGAGNGLASVSAVNYFGTDTGGAANTYVVAITPTSYAYPTGSVFSHIVFNPGHSSTAASTLQVNSLGTLNIVKTPGNAALASGDLVAGTPAILECNSTQCVLENPQTATAIVTAMSGASTTAVSAGASLNAAANTPTCVDGSSQLTTVGCTGGSSTNAELPLVNVAIAAGTNRFLGAQTSSTVEVNVQNIAHATMHVVGMVCAVSAALGSGCSGGVCHATYTLRIGAFGSAGSNGSNSCVVTTSGSCTSTAADTITAGQAFSVLNFTDTSATSVSQTCTITYHE